MIVWIVTRLATRFSRLTTRFPKPKPWLLESVEDFAIHITRTPISKLPYIIDEFCVVKLDSDFRAGSIEHHLNYAFVSMKWVVDLSSQVGCNIDTSLTSIDIAESPNIEVVNREVPLFKIMLNLNWNETLNVKFRIVERDRQHIYGWRLNGEEFDELNDIFRFIVEECCDSLGLNGHMNLPLYSKQNSVLDHDASG